MSSKGGSPNGHGCALRVALLVLHCVVLSRPAVAQDVSLTSDLARRVEASEARIKVLEAIVRRLSEQVAESKRHDADSGVSPYGTTASVTTPCPSGREQTALPAMPESAGSGGPSAFKTEGLVQAWY